ncbi:MAG: Cof-type HAD-IIB family hydrolase [Rikenellaceae bacterium]
MKQQNYDLLVLDIDGTLVNTAKQITDRNKQAIIELQKRGVKAAIASGRPTHGVKPMAKELEFGKYGGYILSNNGGVISDFVTGEVIYSAHLPMELIPDIYSELKSKGCALLYHRGEYIYTEEPEQQYVAIEAYLNRMILYKVDNFVDSITEPVIKLLGCGEPEVIKELEERLSAKYEGIISVYRSEPYFLEIVPIGIDKGASIEMLLDHMGSSSERAIAFGDGFNDVTMIEYVGTGVAMENAQDAVKQVAQAVTASNDEDGVAEYIEKFLL